ncbi:MAG: hypothetical protein ABSF77_18660 [Spirochaetia bacterium]|jgi:hypothetical protein
MDRIDDRMTLPPLGLVGGLPAGIPSMRFPAWWIPDETRILHVFTDANAPPDLDPYFVVGLCEWARTVGKKGMLCFGLLAAPPEVIACLRRGEMAGLARLSGWDRFEFSSDGMVNIGHGLDGSEWHFSPQGIPIKYRTFDGRTVIPRGPFCPMSEHIGESNAHSISHDH